LLISRALHRRPPREKELLPAAAPPDGFAPVAFHPPICRRRAAHPLYRAPRGIAAECRSAQRTALPPARSPAPAALTADGRGYAQRCGEVLRRRGVVGVRRSEDTSEMSRPTACMVIRLCSQPLWQRRQNAVGSLSYAEGSRARYVARGAKIRPPTRFNVVRPLPPPAVQRRHSIAKTPRRRTPQVYAMSCHVMPGGRCRRGGRAVPAATLRPPVLRRRCDMSRRSRSRARPPSAAGAREARRRGEVVKCRNRHENNIEESEAGASMRYATGVPYRMEADSTVRLQRHARPPRQPCCHPRSRY